MLALSRVSRVPSHSSSEPLTGSSVITPAFIGKHGSNQFNHLASLSAWEVEAGASEVHENVCQKTKSSDKVQLIARESGLAKSKPNSGTVLSLGGLCAHDSPVNTADPEAGRNIIACTGESGWTKPAQTFLLRRPSLEKSNLEGGLNTYSPLD